MGVTDAGVKPSPSIKPYQISIPGGSFSLAKHFLSRLFCAMMRMFMPLFRIFRMKESAQQSFRWAPHTCGVTAVKPKDYQEGGVVEAPGIYQAWHQLRETAEALQLGDILEAADNGELRVCKYVGFEEAKWVLPETKLPADLKQPTLQVEQPVEAISTI